MALLKNPQSEALRIASVRAALARDQRWLTAHKGRTQAGRRAVGQNARKSGIDSIAVKMALLYCDNMLKYLEEKYGKAFED